jgi:hypothetical protein
MDGNLSILAHPLVAPALAGVVSAFYPISDLTWSHCPKLAHAVTNRRPPTSLAGFFLVLLLLPTLLTAFFASPSALSIIVTFFRTLAIYWAALATSVTAYRLSPLHPLARYPGPVGARISRLWWARVSLTGAQHLCAYELHARYGPVVRSGPDHLLIKEADAVSTVLGAKAGWHKGPRAFSPLAVRGATNIGQGTRSRGRRSAWARSSSCVTRPSTAGGGESGTARSPRARSSRTSRT